VEVAGYPVSGTASADAPGLLDVDVHELARVATLVAVRWIGLRALAKPDELEPARNIETRCQRERGARGTQPVFLDQTAEPIAPTNVHRPDLTREPRSDRASAAIARRIATLVATGF